MEWTREILGVCGVLLLLGAMVLTLRRKSPRPGRLRRLTVVERLPLGAHHSIHLVRLGDRAILIGVSPAGCALLETGDWSRFENSAGVAEAPR
jgi:flagellar biogenesis protein FliO